MSDATDTQAPIDRMKIYMELRGLRPNTMYSFSHCARNFLAHVGKAPVDISTADVEGYLLDLARKGRAPQTRNVNLSAVRCLLFAILGSDSRVITAGIPNARHPRRSPEILSGTEINRLLAATASPKYRAIFMLAYSAGLRVGEITALHASDIDSQRMLIHVREGKTGPRDVMPKCLRAISSTLREGAARHKKNASCSMSRSWAWVITVSLYAAGTQPNPTAMCLGQPKCSGAFSDSAPNSDVSTTNTVPNIYKSSTPANEVQDR